ncbi:hypothetical protein ASD22_01345 [Rhodanobacter sp. Root480]|nr:hypothetical protein ASD22_01345 [Rhodanobacter sp. Root480]
MQDTVSVFFHQPLYEHAFASRHLVAIDQIPVAFIKSKCVAFGKGRRTRSVPGQSFELGEFGNANFCWFDRWGQPERIHGGGVRSQSHARFALFHLNQFLSADAGTSRCFGLRQTLCVAFGAKRVAELANKLSKRRLGFHVANIRHWAIDVMNM